MTNLYPYLSFDGNAEEALNLYKEIFNGKIEMIMRFQDAPFPTDESDKNKIMHARLVFDNNLIIVADRMRKNDDTKILNVQLMLHLKDEEKTEIIFSKLSTDGIVVMPLSIQFWGNKYGIVKDKFGIDWMLDCEMKN